MFFILHYVRRTRVQTGARPAKFPIRHIPDSQSLHGLRRKNMNLDRGRLFKIFWMLIFPRRVLIGAGLPMGFCWMRLQEEMPTTKERLTWRERFWRGTSSRYRLGN